ncbi:ABC transporter substrate-binding protein [Novimethylophilus kurashikiensis]|uniref:ABC transporter substrate-binding protein n=1 Tax=Novimethylophilus kurashikiensis TaxID=1825523 RepID=A0A2R5F875_9PROT|nr:ShlB/FhaC/HecB family hemolysin secretion/activation protein [Novimethylophilus kurashikiensis]GBG14019.1 ABC transporter substrate-binding protein [Novimethylophilus kurashikiensis]
MKHNLKGGHIISPWLRFSRNRLAVLALVLANFQPLTAAAASDTSAQELLRQQERQRELRKEMEPERDVRLPQPSSTPSSTQIPLGETPCFVIHQIRLEGDEAEHFQFALHSVVDGPDSVVGLCLGGQGINAVIARLQNAIVAKGYVTTRVLAGAQDLKPGILNLTVIPGRIHAIRFAPDASPRGRYWNALPAKPGDLLNLRDIEQGLENLKRSPTSDADIQIEPSADPNAKPGDSDLVISYRQGFPLRLTLSADDSGGKTTGKYQGGITISGDNLFTLNDLFYYSYNHDLGGGDPGERGTRGYTVHYEIPYGYWLLGVTASEHGYHQSVAGFSQNYMYRGQSSDDEIKLSRLIYRDATRKTSVSLAGYLKTSRNYIDDTEVLVQRRRMAGWQAGLTDREYIKSAILDLGLSYKHGTGMLAAMPAPEETFDEGTSRPKILTADAQFSLPFRLGSQALKYAGSWRAQWNYTPLIPQDRFSIGGRYTVRGFDGENTLSAERGWLVRNDLGLALGQSGQEIYIGIDYGQVSGPSAQLLVGKRLAGAVLGLRGGYLLQRMNLDPALTQKRLGDGFYEQKLIREQVAELTGRRFLTGYSNDEDEYKALMTAGVTFAQAHQLVPGVALTDAQIAQLTSDIVWLVEKDVTLPDGSQTKVLVPQVYVRLKDGDLLPSGALLAGDDVDFKVSGDLTNGGTIAGRNVVSMTADNIKNLSGRINGNTVSLSARQDLSNIGGTIEGGDSLSLEAGRDLIVSSTTRSSKAGYDVHGVQVATSRTNLDRIAGLYVSNPQGRQG